MRINGAYSSCSAVASGVVQGSVLGPLLFALCINDLPNCCPVCVVKLFADDAKAYKKITSEHDRQVLQKSLCNICIWAERWKLDLSYDKCCYLRVGYEDNSLSYRLGQHVLKPCSDTRDLSITVQSNLKPGRHCIQIASKANAQ